MTGKPVHEVLPATIPVKIIPTQTVLKRLQIKVDPTPAAMLEVAAESLLSGRGVMTSDRGRIKHERVRAGIVGSRKFYPIMVM